MQSGYLLRNRYRIEKPLSAGGFGETYIAIDEDYPDRREVVVKHLKPQTNDPAQLDVARRLFITEAKTLAKLGDKTDRIPTLYAHFEEQGEFYLVQEFIDGRTLTQELGSQKLAEAETISIVREILTGLVQVHTSNIIHRDLKPDNIIRRSHDHKLVLIDFGAVKAVRKTTLKTSNAKLSQSIGIGTDGYMPTEQAMGYPNTASDIYAVGAIALQCLTGIHPTELFDDDVMEFRWRHLCQVSDRTANILSKMVASRHPDRYSNAIDAIKAIDLLLTPPIPPTIPSPAQPNPSPAATIKSSPPPKPPITIQSPAPPIHNDRRTFIKWATFGGSGFISVLVLSQLFKKPDLKSQLPTVELAPPSKSIPPLKTLQFTSVKLNANGEIVEKPIVRAEVFAEDLGNGIAITMVKIPAGKFMMGSPASEVGRATNESPQHLVNVPEFYLGQTLVTQSQWQAILGNNPAYFKGNNQLPVEMVSWLDAVDFCEKLSQKTDRTYRLPSEAEWEYACRAGSYTPYAFGETINPAVVNYNGGYPYGKAVKGKYRQKTTPVETFPPNPFGLYDLHGNVFEWCLDEWSDDYNGAPTDGSAKGNIQSRAENNKRLLRGGSLYHHGSDCRSAYRFSYTASYHDNGFGFRVVYR
jgi:eukaryotic-like serine/threonine-protein kinase